MENNNQGELFAALSRAQAKIKGAVKDSDNPFFKSKYADLASVWDACREALAENGLCVVQTTSADKDFGIMVHTTLGHSSGQSISGTLPIMASKEDPQGIGSAISYARRYALAAMVGVYQVDDDAETAMNSFRNGPGTQKASGYKPKAPQQNKTDPGQVVSEYDAAMDYIFTLGRNKGKSVRSMGLDEGLKYLTEVANTKEAAGEAPHPFKLKCIELLEILNG